MIIVGISPIPRSIRAPLVAQSVKNPPAMWETWVQFLGWDDPWRKEWLPTPVFWPGEFHGQRSLTGYSPWGLNELNMSDFHKIYYSVSFLLQECPNHVLFSEMYPAFLRSMHLGYHPTYNLCDVSTVFEISFHARLYVLSAFCSLKLVQNTYYVLFYLILTAAL